MRALAWKGGMNEEHILTKAILSALMLSHVLPNCDVFAIEIHDVPTCARGALQ